MAFGTSRSGARPSLMVGPETSHRNGRMRRAVPMMTGNGRRRTGKRCLSCVQPPSSVLGLPSAFHGLLLRAARILRVVMSLSWALSPIGLDALAPASWSSGDMVAASSAALVDLPQLSPTPPPTPPDGPAPVDDPLLLPDLMTSPPAGLRIRSYSTGRFLRFTNVVWNDGKGPLELFGEPDPATGTTQVVQRAYTATGLVAEWPVGVFNFHPTHLHWHLDGFVVYELWSVGPGGDLDQLMTSSDKLSYCLIDSDVVEHDNPLRPNAREYYGCGRARQGLSVGWGDTYQSYLDGQSLPLDGVPDGWYALVSTANANRVLKEAKISNNAGVVYLQLYDNRMNIIPQSDFAGVHWLTEH